MKEQEWLVERKVDLVLEGLRVQHPVADLCREAGVSPECYDRWQQQFIDAVRIILAYPEVMRWVTVQDCPPACSTTSEGGSEEQANRAGLEEHIKQLEAENADLRRRLWVLYLVTGATTLAAQWQVPAGDERKGG